MRVTTQFICILLNLHVKEARRNNGYLRRVVFPALSYEVSSGNIVARCRVDKWTSIRSLRSRCLSTLLSPPVDLMLQREMVVSKVAQTFVIPVSGFRS
jgi:hypothetical protein